ncbi:MAG TPA: cardiolipin synthase [Planctomycetaceae bacterium]|nr:cardiolipin synthase [Planctomycetaceae bacterium]
MDLWSDWRVLAGEISILGYLLTLALVPMVILTKKPSPVSTVAWVMVIVTMPFLGAILFLIFGINRVGRRVSRRHAAAEFVTRGLPQLASHHLLLTDDLNPTQRSLLVLAERVGETKATSGNRVQLYAHTKQAFEAIQAAIDQAQKSIHLEYYIWQPDKIGTRIRDQLIARAKAGVKVRFLYDALGSMRITEAFLEPMRRAGIQAAPFLPGRSLRERWSINLRSHRKIVLIDSVIGFTGGMNVGDEYLGKNKHFGYWRDTHLKLEGPAVQQLQEVFATDWYFATEEELNVGESFPQPEAVGRVDAQVLAGGPDRAESVFHSTFFAAINEAKQRITLATSYFVPTPALCTALETAALRGVKTRVLVSGPVTYWTSYHACRSFYDELLDAGVEIYEYRRGQQHAKTLTVDGCWSLVGTPNFDARSVFLNFEVGLALYNTGLAEQLEDHFDQDLADSVRIELSEWKKRSTWERVKENSCRMFAPVL